MRSLQITVLKVIHKLINIYHDLGFSSKGAWKKNFPISTKYKRAVNIDMELTELRENYGKYSFSEIWKSIYVLKLSFNLWLCSTYVAFIGFCLTLEVCSLS